MDTYINTCEHVHMHMNSSEYIHKHTHERIPVHTSISPMNPCKHAQTCIHHGHTDTVLMNMNTHELSLVLNSLEVNIDVYTLMCPKLKHLLFLHTHLPPPFFSFSEDGNQFEASLVTLLPQSPKCWDCNCVLHLATYISSFFYVSGLPEPV